MGRRCRCRRCRQKTVYNSGPSKGFNKVLCTNCGEILNSKVPEEYSNRDKIFLDEKHNWDEDN